MTTYQCALCQSNSLAEKGLINGYFRPSVFKVLACSACDTSYVSPMKTDQTLYDLIYSQADKVPGYDRYAQLAKDILSAPDPLDFLKFKEDCYFGVINFLQSELSDASLIVEIGCGQGYLTYALRQAGMNVVGLDLSEKGISIAKKNFGDFYHCMSLQDYVSATGVRPRFIVCTELIEHLENPLQFVNDMLSLCSPDGGLILTTPNKHQFQKSIWNTELPPVHLWWFGPKSMKAIADRIGAEIQIVSMRDFYERQHYKPSRSNDNDEVRPPIFDENRKLISPVVKKSKIRLILRKFEIALKAFLHALTFQNKNSKSLSVPENPEEILSESLCCIYQRKGKQIDS